MVNLRELKKKALAWPNPVRTLVMTEPDYLPVADFLARIGVWEKLVQLQRER